MSLSATDKDVLSALNTIPGFKERTKFYIHDLRKYSDDMSAVQRLTQTQHIYNLGFPCFDTDTAEKILSLPLGEGMLEGRLKELFEKKAQEGEGEVCTSHDLAPLFEEALGVKWAQVNSGIKGNKKAMRKLEQSLLKNDRGAGIK